MQEALLGPESALTEAVVVSRNDALVSWSSSWPSALPALLRGLVVFSSSPLDRLCEPMVGEVDKCCHQNHG